MVPSSCSSDVSAVVGWRVQIRLNDGKSLTQGKEHSPSDMYPRQAGIFDIQAQIDRVWARFLLSASLLTIHQNFAIVLERKADNEDAYVVILLDGLTVCKFPCVIGDPLASMAYFLRIHLLTNAASMQEAA